MAKKKSDKETEPKKVSTKRFSAFLKNETTHFVIGLISVIFAVYLLLAFTSFFFTGAADQSILDNQQPGELMQTANHVKNYAGARGAQLAEFLINECFGLAAYFIILFLAVVGMKLMKAYQSRICLNRFIGFLTSDSHYFRVIVVSYHRISSGRDLHLPALYRKVPIHFSAFPVFRIKYNPNSFRQLICYSGPI
jgi:hypothetical protein